MKLTKVQKQTPKRTPTNAKMIMSKEKTVIFVDNKGRKTKENNKPPKRKDNTNNNKKNASTTPDSFFGK